MLSNTLLFDLNILQPSLWYTSKAGMNRLEMGFGLAVEFENRIVAGPESALAWSVHGGGEYAHRVSC